MRIVILGNANSVNVRNWQQGLAEAGRRSLYLLSTHIDHPLDDPDAAARRIAATGQAALLRRRARRPPLHPAASPRFW